jgi:hypothetical protein
MRVLVTGSREWPYEQDVWSALQGLYGQSVGTMTVVHGACPKGADLHAALWCQNAIKHGLDVVEERHPANWRPGGVYDKGAGFKRNAEMVESKPDVCAAFIYQNSSGATHTLGLAKGAGVKTITYEEH